MTPSGHPATQCGGALPRITLVTPTYNHAEFLPATLSSVGAQGYPNLEYIVRDAMSSDATPGILSRFAPADTRIVREPDDGQSDAVNRAIQSGSGEIAGWLNSDDTLEPGALFEVAGLFQANPDAAVIYGRGAKMDRAGSRLYETPYRPFDPVALRTAFQVIQPAMFFRRDAFLACGGLDRSLEYAMDWDLLIRLSARGRVVATDALLANLRVYGETKTATGGWARMREIAGLGRRHNGPLDINFLSFKIRRAVSASRAPIARRIADELLRRVARGRPVMNVGWPDDPPAPTQR